MTKRPMTVTELVSKDARAHQQLCGHFGPETVARLLDLEREFGALLEHEIPAADADRQRWWAGQLAYAVVTDSWFAAVTRERPSKQAKALAQVHQAARKLLQAIDGLPEGALFGMHMRLLLLDLPPPAMRQVLLREQVHRTTGQVNAGLNRCKAAVAQLALAAAETREGIRASGGGKHRADRLARHVADACKDLGAKATESGTGEGAYPRLVAAILAAAGAHDASWVDVARREAKRRHAALRSGKNDAESAKISTGRAHEM